MRELKSKIGERKRGARRHGHAKNTQASQLQRALAPARPALARHVPINYLRRRFVRDATKCVHLRFSLCVHVFQSLVYFRFLFNGDRLDDARLKAQEARQTRNSFDGSPQRPTLLPILSSNYRTIGIQFTMIVSRRENGVPPTAPAPPLITTNRRCLEEALYACSTPPFSPTRYDIIAFVQETPSLSQCRIELQIRIDSFDE